MESLTRQVKESGCFNEASAKLSKDFKQRSRIYILEGELSCTLGNRFGVRKRQRQISNKIRQSI